MKFIDYLKDRMLFIGINIILFFASSMIMIAAQINYNIIFWVLIIWDTPLLIYIIAEYLKVNNYYNSLISISESLDKKYLISEVIEKPNFIEGEIIHDVLIESHRNMQEHVKFYKNQQNEYKEYIETWVHEIKTPIASSLLIVENNEDKVTSNIKNEIKKIEGYVDQALYYSRSNDVSKDYIVKKFNLDNVVRNVVRKNATDFINKRIGVEINNLDVEVYSDVKWVEFIINQIIVNSIKYCKNNSKISINSKINKNNTILIIKDNGIGINEKDINRVFEKGFTGENGRIYGKSTGIGLYLCKKLCNKLGLGIEITSKESEGTEVQFIFPIKNFS